jgi:preprotein translocase subunit SecA
MDYLREGIHLRGMAQKDPLVEYRLEGHQMFQMMMGQVKSGVASILLHANIEFGGPETDEQQPVPAPNGGSRGALQYEHSEHSALGEAQTATSTTSTFTQARSGGGSSTTTTGPRPQPRSVAPAVGRNDPCPCGSGKKYKRCHGANAA